MFNFQKEVILNGAGSVVVPAGGSGTAKPNIDAKLRIDGGGEYFAKYIVEGKVYKTLPEVGAQASVTIKSAPLAGKHVQILVELGLDRDYRGDFGSALWYFRKPILVDIDVPDKVVTGSGNDLKTDYTAASAIIYKAFKTVVPKEYQFVLVAEPANNSIVITCADSYIKIRKVVISEFICDNRCANSSEEPLELMSFFGTFEPDAAQKVYIDYVRNKVEFGTYDYMIHNLRLPTYENLRFTSPNAPEMPIKGATYTQYSFAYCVPRQGFGGMSVVGQTNHSTTLHTFFVNDTVSADFEKLLGATPAGIGATVVTVSTAVTDNKITILPDAFASAADLKNAKAIADNTKADAAEKARVDAALAAKG